MATGETTATLPATGSILALHTVDTINGVTVSERKVERVILSMRTATGAIIDINPDNPIEVAGDIALSGSGSIGYTGGYTDSVLHIPTISTTPAYVAGDQLGEDTSLALLRTVDGTGTLINVSVLDLSAQSSKLTVHFFSGDITDASDNTAFVWNSGDYNKWLGAVYVADTDYHAVGTATQATVPCSLALRPAVGTDSVQVLIVIHEGATYTSTSALRFRFGMYQN